MGDISLNLPSEVGHVAQNPPQEPIVAGSSTALGAKQTCVETELLQQPPPSQQQLNAFASQFEMTQASPPHLDHGPGPYDMSRMVRSLPQPRNRRHTQNFRGGQRRYNPARSPPSRAPMHHRSNLSGLPPMDMQVHGYYVQQPPIPFYGGAGQMSPTQAAATMATRNSMGFYPNQGMMGHPQSAYFYPQTAPYSAQPHLTAAPYMSTGAVAGSKQLVAQSDSTGRRSQAQGQRQGSDAPNGQQGPARGPPPKPRQSEHAIWIGNLPPQTILMNLVRHICKEAPGLESLFLITKSNCAFANFSNEQTSLAAQQKLHDSHFQSARLVSRLRKNNPEGPTGRAASNAPAATVQAASAQKTLASSFVQEVEEIGSDTSQQPDPSEVTKDTTSQQQDKFFILKSLTEEDLNLSVKTGIWATQAHNEEALNRAFKTAGSVYLVFSANKSGEYFGYARMLSEINEDPAAAIEFAPKAHATNSPDLPRATITEATEHTPKGRIVDDSARGTIFWEREPGEVEIMSNGESEFFAPTDGSGAEGEITKTWGKSFKLEWLSVARLPFYRTKGLRNPWNSYREVKIARGGTELEPSVGRKLIGLFNRAQSPGIMPLGMRPPMTMVAGFSPMQPYGA